jgi:hypothetical protein
MTTITAQTILRSRHAQRPDKVLSTLLLRYPRSIHAEFMTHRVLSKNSASSRAIPVKKLIQDVLDDPFVPLYWGKNQPGMQASEELTGTALAVSKDLWNYSMQCAIHSAQELNHQGAHKQIINRILEPYSHITVVASGTEWSNFRALREHKDAEPHIQILAQEIGRELDREDNIQTLEPGAWHLPFVGDDFDVPVGWGHTTPAIKMSVACCASTSYKTVDGFDMSLEKAIELHDKLVGSTPLHASPAEHVAQADHWEAAAPYIAPHWDRPEEFGNFVGFRQYRKQLPNESL